MVTEGYIEICALTFNAIAEASAEVKVLLTIDQSHGFAESADPCWRI